MRTYTAPEVQFLHLPTVDIVMASDNNELTQDAFSAQMDHKSLNIFSL